MFSPLHANPSSYVLYYMQVPKECLPAAAVAPRTGEIKHFLTNFERGEHLLQNDTLNFLG